VLQDAYAPKQPEDAPVARITLGRIHPGPDVLCDERDGSNGKCGRSGRKNRKIFEAKRNESELEECLCAVEKGVVEGGAT